MNTSAIQEECTFRMEGLRSEWERWDVRNGASFSDARAIWQSLLGHTTCSARINAIMKRIAGHLATSLEFLYHSSRVQQPVTVLYL